MWMINSILLSQYTLRFYNFVYLCSASSFVGVYYVSLAIDSGFASTGEAFYLNFIPFEKTMQQN